MSIIIVGLGIKFLSHMTKETEEVIRLSDKVLYLANDDLYPDWIRSVNPNCESLDEIYFSRKKRADSYVSICDKVIHDLYITKNLCVAIYGHPTFLVQISKEISTRAKNKGYSCITLPAISSLDCLLVDLNINPGDGGLQIYDATELIAFNKKIDTTSNLILFQVAAIGLDGHARDAEKANKGLDVLVGLLQKDYEEDTIVYLYESSQYPGVKSKIEKVRLSDISCQSVNSLSTMYIPKQDKADKNKINIMAMKSIFK